MKNTLTYNVDWRSSRKKASSEARSEISKPKLRSWISGATTAANEMMIKIVLSKAEHRDKIASKKIDKRLRNYLQSMSKLRVMEDTEYSQKGETS